MKEIKYITFSLIVFLLFSCSSSFQEYINNNVLEKEGKNFSDVYDKKRNTTSIKTNGFYYSLDSVSVYKMIITGEEVYRYKFIVDEYSINPQWKTRNKILDTNLAYYFQYLWLNQDGTCFVANWNMLSNDFDEPNYLISEKGNMNPDSVIEKISYKIEHYWEERMNKSNRRTIGLGAYEELKDSINIYYFMGQLELPDQLEHIGSKVLNDTTLKLYKIWNEGYTEKKTDKYVVTNSEISDYLFKFRKSDVIPTKFFMIIE